MSSLTCELSASNNDDRNDMEKFLRWQTPRSIHRHRVARRTHARHVSVSANKPAPRPDLHSSGSARRIQHALFYVLSGEARAPTAAVRVQSKVSSSRLYTLAHTQTQKKICSFGQARMVYAATRREASLRLVEREAHLNNLLRNAPTCRSADPILHTLFQEQRMWMKPGKTG